MNRVYGRALQNSGAAILPSILDALIDFARFVNTPKRHAFIARVCEAWNMNYDALPVFAPQRWSRAAHSLVNKVTSQLREIRFIVREIRAGLPLSEEDSGKMEVLETKLKSHTHLMMMHWLADMLHIEACMSEKAQRGEASAVDQAEFLLRLPLEFEKLARDSMCPTLQAYLMRVSEDNSGRKCITASVLREDSEGYLNMEEVAEVLDDDTDEDEGRVAKEREAIVTNLVELCKSELKPPPDVLAFRRIFDKRTYEWEKIRKDNRYFKDAMQELVNKLTDIFKSAGASWITDSRFVAHQASNLQKLLCGGISSVDWRSEARTSNEACFWRRVRQHSKQVNISLVLYLRKVCLVRDGYGAAVERFISHLNKIVDDPQRRGLGNEKVEDILRIEFNGPCVEEWDASEAEELWTRVFNMRPVKSVEQRFRSLQKNERRNKRERDAYAASQQYQQSKIKKASGAYEQKRLLVALARGAQKEGINKRKAASVKQGSEAKGFAGPSSRGRAGTKKLKANMQGMQVSGECGGSRRKIGVQPVGGQKSKGKDRTGNKHKSHSATSNGKRKAKAGAQKAAKKSRKSSRSRRM